MTTRTRKLLRSAVAAVMLTSAALTTVSPASAGQFNHGNGHGMSKGQAIGFGIAAIIAGAVAAAQQRPARHGTAAKRCAQARKWMKLAMRAERNDDDDAADYRWRKYKQARRDCNNW